MPAGDQKMIIKSQINKSINKEIYQNTQEIHFERFSLRINDNDNKNNNNNNNKYISRALNPFVSNQPEAESAVHVQLKLTKPHIQLKPSKQRNQRRKKKSTQKNKQQQTNKQKQANKQKPEIGG